MGIIGGGILPFNLGAGDTGTNSLAGTLTLLTELDGTLIIGHAFGVDPATLITDIAGDLVVTRQFAGTTTLVTTLTGSIFEFATLSGTVTLVTGHTADLTVTGGTPTMTQAIDAITTGTLIAHWPCDDASGNLTDRINSYNLVISDTGSTSVIYQDSTTPNSDTGFVFGENGGSGIYTGTALDLPNLNSGEYSLFGIFRTAQTGPVGARHGCWVNSDGSSSNYQSVRFSSNGDMRAQSNAGLTNITPSLARETWYSILFVSDGDGTGTIYVDDVSFNIASNIRTTAIGASTQLGFHDSAAFSSDDDDELGIQHVAVWDAALTAQDSTDLFASTGIT